jgi:hypothetical protein
VMSVIGLNSSLVKSVILSTECELLSFTSENSVDNNMSSQALILLSYKNPASMLQAHAEGGMQ